MEQKNDKIPRQKRSFKTVMGGAILADERVIRQIPFIIFLFFLGLLMIANRFWAEKTIRQTEIIQDSLKELRSESITNSAKLMDLSRPSVVKEKVESAGLELEEPEIPPISIKVKAIKDQN